MKSVIEIFADIVKSCESGLTLAQGDVQSRASETSTSIKYLFGNSQYIKDELDTYSRAGNDSASHRFPLIALFTPVREDRGIDKRYECTCKLNLIIACSTDRVKSNEQRMDTSFKQILRPLYERLMAEIRKCKYISVAYDGTIPHTYSENYSYGRYGAYTDSGDKMSQPIDAIDIRNLELNIVKVNECKRL